MRLPQAPEPKFFDETFRRDPTAWLAAVVEVCAAHGIECNEVSAYAEGSNLVAAVDDHSVVKIFPEMHRHQWESERRVLAHLRRKKLPLKVPALVAEGTRDDGWTYVVVEKLPGFSLETCWSEIAADNRARIMERVGKTMAAIHRVPVGELVTLPPEWRSFLRQQKLDVRKKHASLRAPQWFKQGLEELVHTWLPEDDGDGLVMLTGEYTPGNLLLQRDETGWQHTGMIDFGDAMVGPRDYDFLGPTMFICGGDPALVGALFLGYFGEARPIDHQTRMRFMALAVAHRYANFDVQLRVPNWRERADSFEALAELVWP